MGKVLSSIGHLLARDLNKESHQHGESLLLVSAQAEHNEDLQ